MTGRYKILSRMNVRKHVDRAGVITLRYDGHLPFVAHLYGYDQGVFFSLAPSEIPIPQEIEAAAEAAGMIAADHPDMPTFKRSVVDVLLAQATLGAPNLLEELVDVPTRWTQGDQHELERRHARASVAVEAAAKCVLDDLRRRALLRRPIGTPTAAQSTARVEVVEIAPVVAAPAIEAPALPAPQEPSVEGEFVPVSSATVERAAAAISKAREAELPQRLPGGARRQLSKLPPGIYVITGEVFEPRKDLASAMTDAQETAHRKETVVIDWDGEYPVVVRRYGVGGRVVYRVEAALRRAASEEAA